MNKKNINIIMVLLLIFLIMAPTKSKAILEEESMEVLRNPDRGFYKLVQIELNKGKEDFNSFKGEIKNIAKEDTDVSLISFQLNLKQYVASNLDLTDNKIEEINQYFSIMRENGYQVIFRVVYDSKGDKNPEPDFQTILRHIEQLKSVYEKNEDIIFVVEAGYLGSYGEWHDGKYDKDKEKRNQVVNKLLKCIPESIQISLRKPSYIEDYIGNNQTVKKINAFSNDEIARLGLHNDGYLASETDLGTYNKSEREESLLWQGKQTLYTLFGGECQNKDSIYTNLNNAIVDMEKRHCTYMNKTYDREVKEKWKKEIYTNKNSVYQGENGYKYIENHLGYRLVIRDVDMICTKRKINIGINIENVGFGNIIRKKQLGFFLKNENNQYYIESDIDIRKQLNEKMYELTIAEELPKNVKIGEYEVYLKIEEPYESLKNNNYYSIKLANNNVWNENLGANYIGNITISDKGKNNTLFNTIIVVGILAICIILCLYIGRFKG